MTTFENNQEITRYIFSEKQKQIPSNMFCCCRNLIYVSLPDDLEVVYYFAFKGCERLERITFPKTLRQIGFYAFKGCRSLVSVEFQGSDFYITGDAFAHCTSLQKIRFCNTETSEKTSFVDMGAFRDCNKLDTIYIPTHMWIDKEAFIGCDKITRLSIPSDLAPVLFEERLPANAKVYVRYDVDTYVPIKLGVNRISEFREHQASPNMLREPRRLVNIKEPGQIDFLVCVATMALLMDDCLGLCMDQIVPFLFVL